MANEAGIMSAHAKYGESHRDSRYQLLKDVTHWTRQEVQVQKTGEKDGEPNFVLLDSFAEIFKMVDFIQQ